MWKPRKSSVITSRLTRQLRGKNFWIRISSLRAVMRITLIIVNKSSLASLHKYSFIRWYHNSFLTFSNIWRLWIWWTCLIIISELKKKNRNPKHLRKVILTSPKIVENGEMLLKKSKKWLLKNLSKIWNRCLSTWSHFWICSFWKEN